MAIVRIDALAGAYPDQLPEELPAGAQSTANNVVVVGGVLERAKGMGNVITPTVLPYGLMSYRTSSKRYLISMGLAKIYVSDGSTETNITRAAGDYTGTAADRWTSCVYQQVAIVNNGVQKPQYWNGNTATDFADLTNWGANDLCKSIRTYKQFLVALYITTSGTAYPYRVYWSDAADPGSLPSWTVATSTLAGYQDLPDVGPIVDGLTLGDEFVIYSTTGAASMRFVGGQSVMSFRPLPGVPGLLTQNCVVDTPVGHVGLSTGDIFLHAGGQARSIADGRVRRAIFDSMSSDRAAQACFVTMDPAQNQVWICYPEAGQTYCNKAAIWNWIDDEWTFRDLRNATAAAFGQFPEISLYGAWSAQTATWTTITGAWNGNQNPDLQRLVFSIVGPKNVMVGTANDDAGMEMVSVVERTGLHFGDPQTVKLVRGVWPRVQATAGTEIQISVGGSMAPDVDPTWSSYVTYTVGTSQKVDTFASGRFLSYRIRTNEDHAWRIRALDLDVVPQGRF